MAFRNRARKFEIDKYHTFQLLLEAQCLKQDPGRHITLLVAAPHGIVHENLHQLPLDG